MGAFSNIFRAEAPNPWIGGLGLLTFNSLYIYVTFRAFLKETREALSTRVALVLLTAVTCALGLGYGGTWLLFFPLLGLATGAAVRMPQLRLAGAGVTALAGVVCVVKDGWGGLDTAYATAISAMVTAAILSLSDAVRDLRAAREELARRAVEEERLRFSRDLHDLLGHTLSVIVVKSEAARRLARADVDAAVSQITDIESVGRQALTEIREAVTGYREGSLAADLDRARSALTAAGISVTVDRSGPPLPPRTEALLGWVVREAATNVLRHSGAARCAITVSGGEGSVRLTVADDGHGDLGSGVDGTGLLGLRERLATVGGSLRAEAGGPLGAKTGGSLGAEAGGPLGAKAGGSLGAEAGGSLGAKADGSLGAKAGAGGGFLVTAELPYREGELASASPSLPLPSPTHLQEPSADTAPIAPSRPTLAP
ncbi:sensor histidine kinase [Streptomyces cinnabarinus]|uniref:Sensor histidine kinase n=2 Tax=Streptomyces cinnabarinus TaxID=67287 RepID=A0ABY7KTT6_9ACTN|nr:sensor histidine kinase [Streptomyces cinnabarinus]WAZ27070.1 sensor histidine kinase [Streptomyces cinnabarinus]